MEDKLMALSRRLKKIDIDIKLSANYPWIYLVMVNGSNVKETFQANHGFTIAFAARSKDEEVEFTDISEIFKIIRKYK